MTDAISPNRIQPDSPYSDNLALVNDNFDKVVSAVNDIGAKLSSTGVFNMITILPGSFVTLSTNILDPKNEYIVDRTTVIPRYQIFIDNNNDYNYLLPEGASLTSAQKNMSFGWWQARVVPTGSPATTKAVIYGIIRNYDAVSHTAFITIDAGYFSAPVTGVFR